MLKPRWRRRRRGHHDETPVLKCLPMASNSRHDSEGSGDTERGGEMKISYRVAMAQELLRLLAEAQQAHGNECYRLRAMVARQVAELLA